MLRACFVSFALAILLAVTAAQPSIAGAAPAPTTLPDSPVGRQLERWLAALNSGNRQTIRAFTAEHYVSPTSGMLSADRIADRILARFKNSGGLDLRSVIKSTPYKIAVTVQARQTGYFMEVQMSVTEEAPNKILGTTQSGMEAPEDLLANQKLADQEIRDRTDALITKLVEADQFSGVILVASDGQPIYQRAAGLASRTWNMPNRIDTKFNLASISKMFVAVAIAQLVEQGKLSYDDSLDKLLPDYSNTELARKIRLHHLLSHTSGIKEGVSLLDEIIPRLRDKAHPLKDYLALAANDTLNFEPGTKLEYNNYGYMLLGLIIEKASGQDFYDYMRERIFKPAGMNDSDYCDLSTDPPNLATGYMDAPGGMRVSNIFRLPARGVPGGLGYGTAGDLVRFATALENHTLLSAQSLDTIWIGRADYSEPNSQYGYGCIVKRYNGTRIIGHGGGWFGITNKFDIYPDLDYTVVILNNIDSAPNPIAYKLREWLTQGTSARTN